MKFKPAAGRLEASRVKLCYDAGYWRDEVAGDYMLKHAKERPKAIAIVDDNRRITWGELYKLSVRFALHLKELGIEPGDVVGLQLPNWFEYIICYHGIQLAGGIIVQIGADWGSAEMAYGFNTGPAKVAIIPRDYRDHNYAATLQTLRSKLPRLEHVIVARGEVPDLCISLDKLLADPVEDRVTPTNLQGPQINPDQIIRIVFTSGTTGLPKAIMHTTNTLAHSGRITQAVFNHDANDVFLIYLPYSTNFGSIMGLQLSIMVGATMVLMDRFSATRALELIDQEQVTFVPGTPTAFIALSNSPALKHATLGSLRLLLSAGASFPVQSIKELRQKFNTTFIDSFGMNEFGMGFWCLPDDDPKEVDGSIGQPISGVEARVVDVDGRMVPNGETGELVIKSAGMCAGYHNNTDAASSWNDEGWFHSGDLATLDDRGYFRIVGRSKDVIIRGGATVSPREIEEVLIRDPRIREVSIIGLPDQFYGEIICACIIPKTGRNPTTQEIQEYLKTQIASYKMPSRVAIFNEFPLNSMGKVRKDVLREKVLGLKDTHEKSDSFK